MLILSEHLKAERFSIHGVDINLHCVSDYRNGGSIIKKIKQLSRDSGTECGKPIPSLLVGESKEIRQIRTMLPNISKSPDSILIEGEKGTGKELLSRLISGPTGAQACIVKVDCSILEPDVLINGAMKQIIGLIHQYGFVTVLLSNIHLVSLALQADLLLLVEEMQKIKGTEGNSRQYGARFICTSAVKIDALVEKGDFRKDLYYRLNVIPIFLPPLRNRKMDISMLMDYFTIDACIKTHKCISVPSQKDRELLALHDWPGNLDELKRSMARYVVDGNRTCLYGNKSLQRILKCSGESLFTGASANDLPKTYEIKDFIPTAKSLSLKSICDEFVFRTEKKLLKKALASTNWNRKKAAELLNISYKSMLNKMKIYDII
ncbi:MAG: sigma 54-interacting transcriptional regulator [Desulfobacteraceae bacterium]